ncbi:MAG: hypothetical protein ACYTGZ_02995 [Planctomycetota bacterium]|jgi:hypothetical protein
MRTALLAFLVFGFPLWVGCRTVPLHEKGDKMWNVTAAYGNPIVGKSLAWDGGGDAETLSAGATHYFFVSDRIAIGPRLTAVRFQETGEATWGGEIEGTMRWWFAEINEWKRAGFFWDLSGGFLLTNQRVPPNGTRGNFTFSFGPGVEVPLNDTYSVFAGIEYHHLSNAFGRDSNRNPSENRLRFWIAWGVRW